jgi:hypothetical protein
MRANWVTFIAANFFNGNYDITNNLIDQYKQSFSPDSKYPFEESEVLLFQTRCLQKLGMPFIYCIYYIFIYTVYIYIVYIMYFIGYIIACSRYVYSTYCTYNYCVFIELNLYLCMFVVFTMYKLYYIYNR